MVGTSYIHYTQIEYQVSCKLSVVNKNKNRTIIYHVLTSKVYVAQLIKNKNEKCNILFSEIRKSYTIKILKIN